MHKASSEQKVGRKPDLSVLALISFVGSFAVARTFTILNPRTVVVAGDFHIHHFWYGIALLVIGGWLGISYRDDRIDRIAAIVFGIGGGLVGDEVGILLTFQSENYWAGISYTLIIAIIAAVSTLTLLNKYSEVIRSEFAGFIGGSGGLYLGAILLAISLAFVLDTNFLTDTSESSAIVIAIVLFAAGCATILGYYIQRTRARWKKNVK
jgi:hypothetical protein